MQIEIGGVSQYTIGVRPGRFICILGMLCCLLFASHSHAQEKKVESVDDRILPVNLEEVIIVASYNNTLEHRSQHKPLSTLDEYLESSRKVNMIKRGAYAWEPVLNDMSSERLSVTIDGMRIFGACTDKMDPVTSYVDVSNLKEVHVSGGQQGAEQGSVIGGSIDLKLEKSDFVEKGWSGSIETGGESSNVARIFGGELNYSDSNFYVDTDAIYRKADNYSAGGGDEVAFSQYEKFNLSTNAGFRVSEGKKLSASFIFDEARDVGYPALPMDVSLARAYIASVSWSQQSFLKHFTDWETKLYANTVTHVMDDSKRPDVPIRMDMPGWSDTYGYYTQANLKHGSHGLLLKLDGYYNRSLAEMTMYPQDPDENPMFMLTWPDVRTFNLGFYAEDMIQFKRGYIKLSTRLAINLSHVADEFGLNSLRIFYPDMPQHNNRFLKSFSMQYYKDLDKFHVNTGVSYGDRAPSVSEGYGFYLFNSFDNHDYIGDPELSNEKALEANAKVSFKGDRFRTGVEGNYFFMQDYMLGEVDPTLSVMTIGADGVKIYKNLDHAHLYNISWENEYDITPALKWTGVLSYHRGVDNDNRNLPFISPLAYNSGLRYAQHGYTGSITMKGAASQENFNPDFGEDKTDAYMVFSLSMGKKFTIDSNALYVKLGVENIFDEYYSTYTDWKNIPRMGRNFFMTVSYAIN